jgi:hypothetical protein
MGNGNLVALVVWRLISFHKGKVRLPPQLKNPGLQRILFFLPGPKTAGQRLYAGNPSLLQQ